MNCVGIDILEVERFIDMSENENKMKKIFTQNEIQYFQNFKENLMHIAGCFCAKEAVAKAFKTGFGKLLSPIDVEIMHNKDGSPFINTNNLRLNNLLKGRKIEISISHTKNFATAICVIE
ncbi:MAG: holo-[acyl-carrier-protein] synthase [Clostridia bacterium]|nr:holo-[acyl-carrier-protein] synthase [Clostridia bacterium]